jgi:ferredoxin
MIIAEQKAFERIREMISSYDRVLVVGCGTCVSVCFAGGDKEVGILASSLRMADKVGGEARTIEEATIQRQCEWEFIDSLKEKASGFDAILSLGCGVGVQTLADALPGVPVLPGLNTTFMGLPTEPGVWAERCAACGDCVLDKFGGICPIARCSKSIMNGPCGGSSGGKCEIDGSVDCAWQLIYDRLASRDELWRLEEIVEAKDWRTSRDGGPRKIVREDLRALPVSKD